MAESSSGGGSGWVAFIAGILLVAIIAVGVVAYTGGLQQPQRTAQLDVNMPNVKINPPDVHLPPAPSPQTPPTAQPSTPADNGATAN